MRAFRFRSQDQFHYALGIIFNKKLHCSDWSKLNDPVEGAFVSTCEGEFDHLKKVNELLRNKKKVKVCALSKTINSHLLWAHYASGFSGLALEIELPADCPNICKMRYGDVFHHIHVDHRFDANAAAEAVLSRKYKEWEYEKEIRILHRNEWFPLQNPVRRVIVGHRMNYALKKL